MNRKIFLEILTSPERLDQLPIKLARKYFFFTYSDVTSVDLQNSNKLHFSSRCFVCSAFDRDGNYTTSPKQWMKGLCFFELLKKGLV